MPKLQNAMLSPLPDTRRDRLAMVTAYSQRLRFLARCLSKVGRTDLYPILMDVATEMQAIAHDIVESRAGFEIVLRATRLIDAAETLVAGIAFSDTVH